MLNKERLAELSNFIKKLSLPSIPNEMTTDSVSPYVYNPTSKGGICGSEKKLNFATHGNSYEPERLALQKRKQTKRRF